MMLLEGKMAVLYGAAGHIGQSVAHARTTHNTPAPVTMAAVQ